jgi:hypothetical protein
LQGRLGAASTVVLAAALLTTDVACGGKGSAKGALPGGAVYAGYAGKAPKPGKKGGDELTFEIASDGATIGRVKLDMVTVCRFEGGYSFGTLDRSKTWKAGDESSPRIATSDRSFAIHWKDGDDRIEISGRFPSETTAKGVMTIRRSATVPSSSGFGTEDAPCKEGPLRWTVRKR